MSEFETVRLPICKSCDNTVDVWNNESITNVWQKNGYNHYDYVCPDCESDQSFKIEIEVY